MESWMRLKSAQGDTDDIGDHELRLDRFTLGRLSLTPGEVVELRSRTSAWLRVTAVATDTLDERRGLVHVDSRVLADIGSRPGDWLFLRPALPRTARHVTLRLVEDPSDDEAPGAWNLLEGRTLIVGDVVRVGATVDQKSGEAHLSLGGLRLLTVDVRQGSIEPAVARVDATSPSGPVTVVASTIVDLLPRQDDAA